MLALLALHPSAVRTFTGAWIETLSNLLLAITVGLFAPSRVRGLKHLARQRRFGLAAFAPSRVRGLKLMLALQISAHASSHLHGCVD